MSTHQPSGVLGWLRHATADERKALVAGGLGWMLDAFDVMLYAMVLAHLMLHFGMDKATAGLLQGLTLLSSAVGGAFFGFFADRFGRARALMVSILIYSLASGACAFSQSSSSDSSASSWAWGWAANGPRVLLWWQKPGGPSTGPKRWR